MFANLTSTCSKTEVCENYVFGYFVSCLLSIQYIKEQWGKNAPFSQMYSIFFTIDRFANFFQRTKIQEIF